MACGGEPTQARRSPLPNECDELYNPPKPAALCPHPVPNWRVATVDGVMRISRAELSLLREYADVMVGDRRLQFHSVQDEGAGLAGGFQFDLGGSATSYADGFLITQQSDFADTPNTLFAVLANGNVGVATTSPWRTLSVTGTVGFDGLTGSTGAGSLCLDSNKQVVYNSASDNCLSSTRATKHDIHDLQLDSLSLVDLLQPVSFVYNGSEQVRYGFIAEDTANVDAHLATYDAAGAVRGIDDRSILAVVIGAIKDLWAKVLALIASDEAQNARIEQLEEEVAALKGAAAGTSNAAKPQEAPASEFDIGRSRYAGTTSITTPSDIVPITSATSTPPAQKPPTTMSQSLMTRPARNRMP